MTDPITIEVTRHKLEGIANEMQSTLLRSSFSPIVKEGLDASSGLFTADGQTLAQACAIPIHLATLIPVMQRIIRDFPPDRMHPEDVFLLNDPYTGGTHLPDIAIVRPIIIDGRLLAFSAAMTHHQDMGGMSAGSVPTHATEIYQEGLRLPPLKLHDAGVENATLVRIIRQNVRIPDTVMGDINAQVAACKIGMRRVTELAAKFGHNALISIFEELLSRSETMTRQALALIPEGTYKYVDYLDNDGIELDKPIRIEVAVTLKDGDIHIDFTGTSDQVRGPMNCVPSGSLAAACFAIRALTDPAIPTNAGCFRPISLHLPEGSLVNPREPAPVNARTSTIKRITGSIISALAEVLPDRIPAPSAGEMLLVAFGGQGRLSGNFVTGDLIASGSGAASGSDGVGVIETDATNCMNLPAEAMEMETPIRLHRVALRTGSGGAGQFRGGPGTVREYEVLVDNVTFTHRGERHFSAARGVFGGGDGARAHSVIVRADGTEEVIPSKIVTRLMKGDRVVVQTAGGAGHGDPAKRDPASTEADVADGVVLKAAGPSVRSPDIRTQTPPTGPSPHSVDRR
jgi:N-methylhydantoinase B/oxoprolinase/acetone carboxylase alpha subunit